MTRLTLMVVLVAGLPGVSMAGEAAKKDLAEDDVVAVSPFVGIDKVEPMKPSWCELAKSDSYSGGALRRTMERLLKDGWTDEQMADLAEALCVNPEGPNYQKATAAYLQAFVNATGLSVADAQESIRARLDREKWKSGRAEICAGLAPGAEASPEDRALAGAREKFYGCNRGNVPQWMENGGDDIKFYLDKGQVPEDPVLHVYEVRRCLRDTWSASGNNPTYEDMFVYATCLPLITRLDKATFDKALEAPGMNAYAKATARESFGVAKVLGARYGMVAKDISGKEPAFNGIFSAAEKAWTAWEKLRAEEKASFDAAYAYEKLFYGPSKKARVGCFTGLRDLWVKHLSAKKPKTEAEAKKALNDEVGYSLTASLLLCAAADDQSVFSNLLATEFGKGRPMRGPRTGAFFAALDAVNEVLADREKFPMRPRAYLGYSAESVNNDASYARAKGSFGSTIEGVVAKTQPVGDRVKVIFKKDTLTVDDLDCKRTNRIAYIDVNGQFQYESDCKVIGKRQVTSQVDPIVIPAWSAKGLTPGGVAGFYAADEKFQGTRTGFPMAVYADKNHKTLTSYFGAPVK